MNLVSYSDSEGSDLEAPAHKTPKSEIKPAAKKVIDRADTGRIRVHLPGVATQELSDGIGDDGPPAKRARTSGGGGLFSGMSSFLPAPKRATTVAAKETPSRSSEDDPAVKRGLGRKLGSGVSLKTGAAPGFTRESMPVASYGESQERDFSHVTNSSSTDDTSIAPTPIGDTERDEVKAVGKVTMFRPLSIARKPGSKKKKPVPAPSDSTTASTGSKTATYASSLSTPASTIAKKPKVSLFSIAQEDTVTSTSIPQQNPYEAHLKQDHELVEEGDGLLTDHVENTTQPLSTYSTMAASASSTGGNTQSLRNIASDLNLSEADKRQLFGRKARGAPDTSAINVVNFNMDSEYAANEELRAKGEVVSHQPVKSIAAGRHSLRQLVNTAVTQKDALEESFAQGSRNKREAGSRYGW